MLKLKITDNNPFNIFYHNVKSGIPFKVTGLTTLLRLYLTVRCKEISNKKVLLLTASEQNALKYKNDFEKAFDINAEILPFQNISMYETVDSNKYDYAEQINILLNKPEIVICPVKAALEKFPAQDFYIKNSIKIYAVIAQ